MELNAYSAILILTGLVIVSYLFSILSAWSKIPSVLLLMALGVLLKYFSDIVGFKLEGIANYVQFFGVIGLIMIVLEATLDLEFTKEKIGTVRSAFFSSMTILIVSSGLVTFLFYVWLEQPFRQSIVYAIPLSIISSAIVIPSVMHMTPSRKEFIIFEVAFFDILGVMLFNYFLSEEILTGSSVFSFFGQLLIIIALSFIASVLLLFVLSRITNPVKIFLLFSVLIMLYVIGKLYHLPSLMVIVAFGLVLDNFSVFTKRFPSLFHAEALPAVIGQFKIITAESSFLIRTYFFVLFGYSINLGAIGNLAVIEMGSAIVIALLLVRFLYLRFFVRSRLWPELFIMPRGLVTILLFYSIPNEYRIPNFDEGILFFVIVVTTVMMMIGLSSYKNEPKI
jgi:hypothetical protein